MISQADVDKLLSTRATGPEVLSLYLPVPADPAELRGLAASVGELVAAAEHGYPDGASAFRVRDEDRQTVRDLAKRHARAWLGHTAAIFACGRVNLREAFALPCRLPGRAVLAARPHVRPLLVALQRCPAFYVAVIDRRRSWIFTVTGERIDTMAQQAGEPVRSPSFGGWYGLQEHRVHERVIQLTHHHYRATAAVLERAMRAGDQPLVLGGHEQSVPQFLAELPDDLRDRFAGSFVVDPHTMTPARIRELAADVIGTWVAGREKRLVAQFCELSPGALAVAGLAACATAVNERAVQLLIVPDNGLVPGFACDRCGLVVSAGSDCPICGAAERPVPDLIEEMVVKTITEGGQVEAVADPPGGIAAQLRFPLTAADK